MRNNSVGVKHMDKNKRLEAFEKMLRQIAIASCNSFDK